MSKTSELIDLIRQYFSKAEVEDLCFRLGIDYDDLPGEGKANKVMHLVRHCRQHSRLVGLTALCAQLRPHVMWPPVAEVEAEDQLGPVPEGMPPTSPFMAPDVPGDFVPRPNEFERLVGYLLDREGEEAVALTAALRGAGGYGKTTLAAAVCHDPRVRAAYPEGILWITLGEKPKNLAGLVEDLVYALVGQRPGFVDLNAAAASLAESLGERRCGCWRGGWANGLYC